MIVVVSDDTVTIDGVEVRIPYAHEKPLSKSQEHWLEDHGIEVLIVSAERRSYPDYFEAMQLLSS